MACMVMGVERWLARNMYNKKGRTAPEIEIYDSR